MRYGLLAELSRREKEAGIKPDPEIDAFTKATAMIGLETSLITDYVLKVRFLNPTTLPARFSLVLDNYQNTK